MACNCGTKEEIDKLYRAYGEKLDDWDSLTVGEKVKNVIYKILTYLTWVIVLPLMVIYIILFLFWSEDKRINVQNFNLLRIFKLKPSTNEGN